MPAHVNLVILLDACIFRFIKSRCFQCLRLRIIQRFIGYPADITIICCDIAPVVIGFEKHHLLTLGYPSEHFTLHTALIAQCGILLRRNGLLFIPLCCHDNTVRLCILCIIHLCMRLHKISRHIICIIISTHDCITFVCITAAVPCLHSIALLVRCYRHHLCRCSKQKQLLIVIPVKTCINCSGHQRHAQIYSAVNCNRFLLLQQLLIQCHCILIIGKPQF